MGIFTVFHHVTLTLTHKQIPEAVRCQSDIVFFLHVCDFVFKTSPDFSAQSNVRLLTS